MKKIISLVLIVIILCSAISGCFFDDIIKQIGFTTINPEYEGIVWEEKIYWEGDINDDFEPGVVLVILDKAISEPNKIHSVDFFVGVDIESIKDLTYRSYPDSVADKENFNQILSLNLVQKTKEAVISAIEIIEKIVGVKYVSPNGIDPPEMTYPNDEYFSYTAGTDDQWALDSIEAPWVWDFTAGSSGIRVGVIDAGISSHMDLNGNYLDNDALDFYSSATYPSLGKLDINSHGTHVAGIIGAVGNNNEGISGINWDVSLVQMRVGENGFDRNSVVEAIKWASDHWDTSERIHIISYSSGVYDPRPQYEEAIREYCSKGGLFICSTGNKPQDNDVTYHYPSFYGSSLYSDPIPNMITVGRIDINDERPSNANWGQNTIMIYAPGQDIVSTIPLDKCAGDACTSIKHIGNGYHRNSGSSMSTPHVSGVAALLLSVNPDLTAAQLKECILNGADNITITVKNNYNQDVPQNVKKLNAWGAFQYLMENHPTYERDIGYYDRTCSYDIDADASYMKDHTAMMKFNSKEAGNYTFTITSYNSMEVKLYDHELNEITVTQIKRNGNREIEITYALADDETYYLRANYTNNYGEGNISVYVDSPTHTHVYSRWVKYSESLHIELCECGFVGTETSPHVVRGEAGLNFKAQCIECGAWVDVFDNHFPSIMSITKYSVNGSYILPNGIIVLVEEDVEAYLNGTLVFYDKDKLPVTQ